MEQDALGAERQLAGRDEGVQGTVRITGHRGAEVWVDDRMLGEIPLDVLVPAGLHVIELRARGYESQRRELRVSARTVHDVEAKLELIDTYRGLPSTYFWVGTGLTAVAVITGASFGVAALIEDADGRSYADRDLTADGEAAKDLAFQADIVFGAAIALGVGTTVLYFLADWAEPEDSRVRVTSPGIAIDPNGTFAVTLSGPVP